MSETAMPRPGVPYPAPRGQVWAPVVDDNAFPVWESSGPHRDRKCQHQGVRDPRRSGFCNARVVMNLAGQYRCVNHTEGRWIAHGVVMQWALEPTDEQEEK